MMKKTLTLVLIVMFNYSLVFAQTTLDFNGAFMTIASGSGTQSGNITLSDGIGYTLGAVGAGGFSFVSRNGGSQISSTLSGTISYFHFERTMGAEFQLDNINLQFNISNITSATLEGYRDGTMVSGATQTITFVQNVAQTVDVSSIAAFDNIDEFRISFPSAPNNNGNTIYNSLQYSNPLPVELYAFQAILLKSEIMLNWKTASELNNEKFIIEESQNGRGFQKIGEIHGKGTTLEQHEYLFKIKNPRRGISYYRLKQIDFDGQFEYSKIVSVNFREENKKIGEFYPNPSKSGIVNLDYPAQNDEKIAVSVFGITGKLVTKQTSNGNNNFSFDFSNLNTGIYIVIIGDENNVTSRKLIIER